MPLTQPKPYSFGEMACVMCTVHVADDTVFSVDRLSIVCAIVHCAKQHTQNRIVASSQNFHCNSEQVFMFCCLRTLNYRRFLCGGDGRRINCVHTDAVVTVSISLLLLLLPFLSLWFVSNHKFIASTAYSRIPCTNTHANLKPKLQKTECPIAAVGNRNYNNNKKRGGQKIETVDECHGMDGGDRMGVERARTHTHKITHTMPNEIYLSALNSNWI